MLRDFSKLKALALVIVCSTSLVLTFFPQCVAAVEPSSLNRLDESNTTPQTPMAILNSMSQEELERMLFEHVNMERVNLGLHPYIWDDDLAKVARAHSEDLYDNGMTGHTGSDGSNLPDRVGRITHDLPALAENCSMGEPLSVIAGWMLSPPHRANLLSADLAYVGVGYSNVERNFDSPNDKPRATMVFASRAISTASSAIETAPVLTAFVPANANIPNSATWSLPTMDGQIIDQDVFKGKPMVLFIYRADGVCGGSTRLLKTMVTWEPLEHSDAVIIAVDVSDSPREVVEQYLIKNAPINNLGIIFTYGSDSKAMYRKYLRLLSADGISSPGYIAIDVNNNIRHYRSYITELQMCEIIKGLSISDEGLAGSSSTLD